MFTQLRDKSLSQSILRWSLSVCITINARGSHVCAIHTCHNSWLGVYCPWYPVVLLLDAHSYRFTRYIRLASTSYAWLLCKFEFQQTILFRVESLRRRSTCQFTCLASWNYNRQRPSLKKVRTRAINPFALSRSIVRSNTRRDLCIRL